MKKSWLGYGVAALGGLLIAAGLWLVRAMPEAAGMLAALPYVCIGVGCGAFGYGVGTAVNAAVMRKDPELAREMEIEARDERNVAIANRAKARALDRMYYIFGALLMALPLMGVDAAAVLLLVAAYLFVVGSMVYYLWRYHKEM